MIPLLSPEEMGTADRAAIASGTPGAVLMERAGHAAARAVLRLLGARYGARAVVVCGKGNNGGDGFVVARRLARAGVGVRCLVLFDPAEARGDAALQLERMRRAGVAPQAFETGALAGADIVVDAVFGTGFAGRVEGAPAGALVALSECGAPVLAIDIPSGVNGATGTITGPAVEAAVTVAMGAQKLGTALAPGAANAGRVEVVDIGIGVPETNVALLEAADVASRLPRRSAGAHKRSAGAVALLGGSAGMSGAVLLAGRAAARSGAGYVTVGATRSVDGLVSLVLPEVLSHAVTTDESLGPGALEAFAPVLAGATVLALGPGLGRGPGQGALVERALKEVELPLVLDADGLSALAEAPRAAAARTAPLVLTPHPAEMARLLKVSVPEVQADRLGAARAAARRYGCIAVLKGFRTVVAAPEGRAVINPTGGPALASAGTGDVLTGVTAALLAAGLAPFEAAFCAVYVHGLAGDLAGAAGPQGVIAWDVAEALPRAIAELSTAETTVGR